ncbi:hypothetical protein [Haploplasma axanthum]|uniref:Pyridoxamine 5'-phosphate oxidase n=1 Tax=Haploplasma axanthum TaxID=29552 RepID=A0A449BDT9_HAPAX|nr:hypothetical protein [Haploplasma axanthum]VEU80587.1 Uncharacterised protein [Haploplasma axanthum]
MTNYEIGLKILEDKCGNNKDNVLSLATISLSKGKNGKVMPSVRDVDAYYEDGVFYVVTYALSNKMLESKKNENVAFSVNFENISGQGVAENLGWVLDPKNSELRTKLRTVFAAWYDEANNEQDVNFCYLAIRITKATVVTGHGPTTKKYYLDFINKKEIDEIKEMKKREAIFYSFSGIDAIETGRKYISKWLDENKIDLEKEEGPIYIIGSYDLNKINTSSLEFCLYFIIPKTIKLLTKTETKKILGDTYARRYTKFDCLDIAWSNLYNDYTNDSDYKIVDTIIYEQYLIEKNYLESSSNILQLLSVDKE